MMKQFFTYQQIETILKINSKQNKQEIIDKLLRHNILKNGLSNGVPSELLFAVEEDMFLLLNYAQNVEAKIKIIPVIRGTGYSGDTEIYSLEMKQFINSQVSSHIGTESTKGVGE